MGLDCGPRPESEQIVTGEELARMFHRQPGLSEARITEDYKWRGGWRWTCKHGNESSLHYLKLECGCALVLADRAALASAVPQPPKHNYEVFDEFMDTPHSDKPGTTCWCGFVNAAQPAAAPAEPPLCAYKVKQSVSVGCDLALNHEGDHSWQTAAQRDRELIRKGVAAGLEEAAKWLECNPRCNETRDESCISCRFAIQLRSELDPESIARKVEG